MADVERVLRDNAEAIREADEVMERLAGAPERAREYAEQIRLLLAREREARERAEREIEALQASVNDVEVERNLALARAEKAEAEVERLKSQIHRISQEP